MRCTTVGLLISALVVLGGCCGEQAQTPPVPPKAVAGQITSQPCTFKRGKAEYAARCGFLFVPENRANARSRLIALPYTQVLAQTKTPGAPIFALAGGPGQSNMSPAFPVSWFVAQHDIVMVGYRGVDGTVRLDCPQLDASIRRGGPFFNENGLSRLRGDYRSCAAQLTASGVDLAGYAMLDVAEDLEAARTALGYPRVDLLSISYGTRLALIYGWRHPERIARSAMLDVNPPGRFWLDPVLLDRQIRRYAELCSADSYCASRTKDLAADIHLALKNMPKRWLVFPIDRDAVLFATFMALYSTNGAAMDFDMWIAAARGDYSGMALISLVFGRMIPPMALGDSAAKAVSADFESENPCKELEPGRTLIGSPLNVMACAASRTWPANKIPGAYRAVRPSDIETLMLGGSLDIADPPENARDALLPLMPRARQIVMAEASHSADLLYQQPDATQRLLTTFFDTGRVDASQYRYRAVVFDPGWKSLPLIAKTLVGVGLLLIALVAWLALRVARRLLRRTN